MLIEPAKPEEAVWLDEVIKREFPYVAFTPDKIIERINNPKYLILLSRQENIYTGFAELELFLAKNEARMNALYVDDAWRDQKIGTRLVEQCINECKHRKIQRLFLLVKKGNTGAKYLYTKTGFAFEKKHNKKLDDSEVEVWSQNI